mgnify:CR=1 FL=1
MYTLQDVYNIAYWLIAQGQDSTAYPLTLMRSFINKAQNDICYGNVMNLSTGERLEKQALTFLEKNQFYSTHNFSTLGATATVWGTTLTCTNVFATSGYLWIGGDIIQYTGNDWTTITGIPTTGDYSIKYAHISGTQVLQLDVLPTDMGQLSRAFLTIMTTRIRTPLIGIDNRDLVAQTPNSYIYQFFYDRAYSGALWLNKEWYYSMMRGQFILFLVPQQNAQPVSVEYQMKPTQLVDTTDALTIPDDYSLNTIPYMAVSEMLANRWDMEQAVQLNNFWFNNIKSMYQYYTTQRQELMYNQRVRTGSDGILNF